MHVTPRSRRQRVGGLHGDALRVVLSAPAVEGRANAACVRALADAFEVSRRAVRIDTGSRSRRKRIEIEGDGERLAARLEGLATDTRLR